MKYWTEIEEMINQAPSLSISTTNADGSPHVTPIGSMFPIGEGKCFYFEKLPHGLRDNLDRDGRFSVLVQRGGILYWLKALWTGKFKSLPAVRLSGKAGKRRECTPKEKAIFDSKFDRFKRTKGYAILWRDMSTVRDLTIEKIEPVNLLSMTEDLV